MIGTEAELLRTLEQTPLPVWKAKTDALRQQFTRAAQAAKLLEPKTQYVHLTSGTLKTEQEVKAWLATTEEELMARLKDGPLTIGWKQKRPAGAERRASDAIAGGASA